MCRSNRTLCHKKKGKERKIAYKIHYDDHPVTLWFEIAQYEDKKRYI